MLAEPDVLRLREWVDVRLREPVALWLQLELRVTERLDVSDSERLVL